MRVKLDLDQIAKEIADSKFKYVRVKDVSKMLGVSTKTAGKILVRLEREGYVKRYSIRAYKVLVALGEDSAVFQSSCNGVQTSLV
ncbi:MAG: hypothetical protein QXN05_02550 [Acidilobaceae archaeon]